MSLNKILLILLIISIIVNIQWGLLVPFLFFYPFLIFVLLLKLISLSFKNKYVHKIIEIVVTLIVIFILAEFLLFELAYIKRPPIENYNEPSKEKYPESILIMTNSIYKIQHFPVLLPENAENYYFWLDPAGIDGYRFHYLRFNTDLNYINQTLNANKNKIYKEIPYEEINYYYNLIDNVVKKNKSNYLVYILKNENNDDNYTSGIIVSEKDKEIIFFFASFNLKIRN